MKRGLRHNTFFGFPLADAAARAGLAYATVWRHVRKHRAISPEAALRYHRFLGIPLSRLRPDLWPPDSSHAPAAAAAVVGQARTSGQN